MKSEMHFNPQTCKELKEFFRSLPETHYVNTLEYEKIVREFLDKKGQRIKTGWGSGKVSWNQKAQRFEPN
jgi:hypothetical protein